MRPMTVGALLRSLVSTSDVTHENISFSRYLAEPSNAAREALPPSNAFPRSAWSREKRENDQGREREFSKGFCLS